MMWKRMWKRTLFLLQARKCVIASTAKRDLEPLGMKENMSVMTSIIVMRVAGPGEDTDLNHVEEMRGGTTRNGTRTGPGRGEDPERETSPRREIDTGRDQGPEREDPGRGRGLERD